MDLRTVSRREVTSVRQLTSPFLCDSRYMTSLSVFKENKPCLELGAANIDPNNQKVQDKIVAALKLLTFREQNVLIQFWWPHEVGKHQFLTTKDQPFGIGATDIGLSLYRLDSELKSFIVDKYHEEVDHSPAARVFRRGLPEWTSDLDNYTPKHFPQKECAKGCNLHGYLALPVFYSITGSCVGVLELLTSSNYMNYDYEVKNIHDALETQNLISPHGFDFPALYVPDKICGILKMVCEIHNLPLAQTWAVSQHTSFVCHEKVIEKSCSSFDTRCIGKVCMSTAGLPFHVKDLGTWSFMKACRERHLDRSCGLVGKALLTRGSCFCGDVTKLSEEEYPLVHNARMNRMTSCFTIFLRSVEANDDYVLEFFLPPDIKDCRLLLNLVQTLKQNIPIGSGFELGDSSCIQVVGAPTDLSVNLVPDVIQISWDSVADNFTSSDSEPLMESGCTNMEKTCVTSTDAGGKSYQGKKRKIDSVTGMVTAEITFNEEMKIVHFPISMGLSYLKNEVVQRFKLKGKTKRLRLHYTDEVNDRILIPCDEDLEYAVGRNNPIKLFASQQD